MGTLGRDQTVELVVEQGDEALAIGIKSKGLPKTQQSRPTVFQHMQKTHDRQNTKILKKITVMVHTEPY